MSGALGQVQGGPSVGTGATVRSMAAAQHAAAAAADNDASAGLVAETNLLVSGQRVRTVLRSAVCFVAKLCVCVFTYAQVGVGESMDDEPTLVDEATLASNLSQDEQCTIYPSTIASVAGAWSPRASEWCAHALVVDGARRRTRTRDC